MAIPVQAQIPLVEQSYFRSPRLQIENFFNGKMRMARIKLLEDGPNE